MIKRFFNLRGIDLCRKRHYDSAFLLFMSTLNQLGHEYNKQA